MNSFKSVPDFHTLSLLSVPDSYPVIVTMFEIPSKQHCPCVGVETNSKHGKHDENVLTPQNLACPHRLRVDFYGEK